MIANTQEGRFQALFARDDGHHLNLGARQADVRGGNAQIGYFGFPDNVLKRLFLQQHVVDARVAFFHTDAASARGIGLGVQVEQEGFLFRRSQARRKVDCRCGLSDAAFLIGYRNDSC